MSEQPEPPVDEVVEDTEAISEANEDADIDAPDVEDVADEVPRRRLSGDRKALIAAGLVVAALTGLTGWLGWGAYQQHQAQVKRNLFVQVARQGAVNLTTIDHTEIEADVQRILDLATGAFRDDFEHRSRPFMELVKAAQSKSEGTVVDAGLESEHGDSAQVLVAVAVKSRTAGGEEAPREWRMRIEVTSVGDDARMSNVVFVP
ncbi:MnhB domain-containing protein [Mycobacterium asiaticum]|uniref:Mce protein n=1 Tax=Mycobacterium asiaticum TaxID=1790 RepID=A0A1A3N541_MYCAS|nr:MnhB domain-containing protein [Mycobacterium asiaticum]OBK16455.1 Mce protein [Mycobacterium asiaticum]